MKLKYFRERRSLGAKEEKKAAKIQIRNVKKRKVTG